MISDLVIARSPKSLDATYFCYMLVQDARPAARPAGDNGVADLRFHFGGLFVLYRVFFRNRSKNDSHRGGTCRATPCRGLLDFNLDDRPEETMLSTQENVVPGSDVPRIFRISYFRFWYPPFSLSLYTLCLCDPARYSLCTPNCTLRSDLPVRILLTRMCNLRLSLYLYMCM